jgi:CRISPR-associated endonuclease/helicase Cas3
MHIVLVSYCERNAIKRTRALLDSYARRTGDRTWLTPITTEGLSELHKALRKSATRQTSVACFRNDGMKRMRLLWTVGNNKNFDKNGISPVATKKKSASIMPTWARICALIAETAGFMHDLGKFNEEFQHKLKNTNTMTMDNVRHEWLSMFLANSLIDGQSWAEAVSLLEKNPKKFSDKQHREETLIFKKNLESIIDSLLYCVATHHKLPSKEKGGSMINNEKHVRHQNGPFNNPKIHFSPSEKLIGLVQRNIKKIKELANIITTENPIYWRAIATLSRMALILADQSISAINYSSEVNHFNSQAYANTYNGQLNQDLSWHLENVGIKAGQMVFHILNIPLPHLSQDAIDQINKPSSGSYEWQNRAAFALSNSRAAGDTPHLVLNMASTGSGKTRMNLRSICALNENKSVRVATALNLRTLTLQTSDAYHKQAKISKDEIACVIGDSLTQKLHENGQNNVDEDESEDSLDVNSEFDFNMPNWLKFYSGKNTKLNDIIGAPVLISTIDFLIAAGEPHRKHHHILAATRIMHSDLILDEIDGYEPMALLSVLRLVTVSAMFGRNVIASSATLSKPIAKMLWQAYNHGAEMRGLINNEPKTFKTAIIDDLIKPRISSYEDDKAFMEDYTSHVKYMMLELKNKPYRVPVLAKIDKKNSAEWFTSIEEWAKILHGNHSWIDDMTGKRISIGLVRIANVTTAIEVATHLSKKIPSCRITCYHSNHFPMQRHHIEQRLDFLLNRNKKNDNPNQHILDDKEIRQILNKAEGDIQFIVVATPVEEIGRDHDFDWAIIEPSSSQSIVQAAGRVNRHRRACIPQNIPNVALLQYCYRELNNEKIVFTKPGLEIIKDDKSTHSSHDLSILFNWSHLNQIDARMRFCSEIHKFSEFDDKAIELKSKDIFKSMLTDDHLWMAQETYTESSLRSSEPTIDLHLIDPNNGENYKVSSREFNDGQEEKYPIRIHNSSSRVSNDWLVKGDSDLFTDAEEHDVEDNKKAMTVSISYFGSSSSTPSRFVSERICRHYSFGFYINVH